MKILLIGGTGVLGRSFCKLAMHRNHDVTALARTPEKAEMLKSLGVETLPGSILDPASLMSALPGHDVVVNLASAVPRKLKPSLEDWKLNDLVRSRGTDNILSALPSSHIFYCQGGLAFVYGDQNGNWVDETSSVQPNRFTASAREAEEKFLIAPVPGMHGVSFRFALFYHQDAWHTQAMVHEMRKRRFPILGDGEYYWNLVHVDDAASAVLTVIEKQDTIHGREIINVVDDQPVLCREFLNQIAVLLEVPSPTHIPLFVARLALGTDTVDSVTASFRCRNERLHALGWNPGSRSFREGFPGVLEFI